MAVSDNPLTDKDVARLLTEDALHVSSRSSRRSALAPKPNTRFLKNILREADGHNAALKRKEEQEAQDRRRRLERDGQREGYQSSSRHGRLTPPTDGSDNIETSRGSKRRKIDDEKRTCGHSRKRPHDDASCQKRRKSRSPSLGRKLTFDRRNHCSNSKDEGYADSHGRKRRLGHPRHGSRRLSRDRDSRKATAERSPSRSPGPQRYRHRAYEDKKKELLRKGRCPPSLDDGCNDTASLIRSSSLSSSASDSDPLDALIGPRPPSPASLPAPAIRGRGRGTFTSKDIDKHFTSNYDPYADAGPDSVIEKDEWGDAVEAFRDRLKWSQIGAQRLRTAGFSEEEIKRWERGKGPGRGLDGEGDVEDVQWRKPGEEKEWDKGKMVNEDGFGLHAQWKTPIGR